MSEVHVSKRNLFRFQSSKVSLFLQNDKKKKKENVQKERCRIEVRSWSGCKVWVCEQWKCKLLHAQWDPL